MASALDETRTMHQAGVATDAPHSSEMDAFEELAARFAAAVAYELPRELRSLAFASPVSVRSPDTSLVWHSGYRHTHRADVKRALRRDRARDLIRAPFRYGLRPRRFAQRLYGRPSTRLLVATTLCGREIAEGRFVTSYLPTDSDDAVLAFGYAADFGPDAVRVPHLPPTRKVAVARCLVRAGKRAASTLGGAPDDRALLLTLWKTWARGGRWLHDYYLGAALRNVLAAGGITQVGCIHEMHPYARIVWWESAEAGATRHTVQHASVTRGKSWYFPSAVELDAGLKVPDTMHVFSERVTEALAPHLPETRFILGCSGRYARWRQTPPFESDGRSCLAVGALARFDNDVVIGAVRRLAREELDVPLRLRLHPYADVARRDREWLERMAREGRLEVSEGVDLETDLEDAAVVLGMGTTVLEEALVLGRPVVQLTHPDFVRYVEVDGIDGVTIMPVDSLCAEDIENARCKSVDCAEARDRLGLDRPLVTYGRLFSDNGV